MATEAFLLNDSLTNLFPSFFLPFIAKKCHFLLTSLELIVAFFRDMEDGNCL